MALMARSKIIPVVKFIHVMIAMPMYGTRGSKSAKTFNADAQKTTGKK